MRIPSVVIEHVVTKEKFMFPYQPITDRPENSLVPDIYVPDEYKLAADQTPVALHYVDPDTGIATVNWAAEPKDPIKTIEERWKFRNGYK
jgi:hypothetical protein